MKMICHFYGSPPCVGKLSFEMLGRVCSAATTVGLCMKFRVRERTRQVNISASHPTYQLVQPHKTCPTPVKIVSVGLRSPDMPPKPLSPKPCDIKRNMSLYLAEFDYVQAFARWSHMSSRGMGGWGGEAQHVMVS